MKIVKCEKIYLSRHETNIWTKFDELIKDLHQGSEDLDTLYLINQLEFFMNELQKKMEVS